MATSIRSSEAISQVIAMWLLVMTDELVVTRKAMRVYQRVKINENELLVK